jgi:ribosome-interacting GTPase 1
MPTNVTAEYGKADQKFRNAKTTPEKIAALKEMFTAVPKHKGTEKLRLNLKKRMKALREEQEFERKRRKGSRSAFDIRKEGFQIAVIGFPNSGKSTFLRKVTNAKPKISAVPFTTAKPIVGMLDYEGAQLQLVEVPALTEGAAAKQLRHMSLLRTADGIIMVVENKDQENTLRKELKEAEIKKKIFMVQRNKIGSVEKKEIFDFFDLIRVYTKEPGQAPDKTKPIVLRKGATITQAGKEIHKDFSRKLDYALVWGSSKFPGQRVERNFILHDRDIVEFHT